MTLPESAADRAQCEAAAAGAIHKADPAVRRNTLVLSLTILGMLLGLYVWFGGYLERLPVEDAAQMRGSTLEVVKQLQRALLACALLLCGLAVYWWLRARAIARVPRYPMPHMRLFHDMRIAEGEVKRRIALRTFSAAVAAGASGTLLFAAALWLPRHAAAMHPALFPVANLAAKSR